jgi:hypothetical protein
VLIDSKKFCNSSSLVSFTSIRSSSVLIDLMQALTKAKAASALPSVKSVSNILLNAG